MTTPKQAFQKNPHAKEFANIAESEAFEQALFAALLQMQFNTPEAMDAEMAAAHQQRITGAKQFIRTLHSLCEPEQVAQAPVPRNLNHRV